MKLLKTRDLNMKLVFFNYEIIFLTSQDCDKSKKIWIHNCDSKKIVI